MAELPQLPIFTDALLADTGHLTNEEFGLYIRLLILMWRTPGCRVPNDQNWLVKRLAPANGGPLFNDFKLIEQTLKEFCTCDGNYWTQKRLTKEYEYVKNRRKSRQYAQEKSIEAQNKKKEREKRPVQKKPLKNNKTQGEFATAPHPTPPTIENDTNVSFSAGQADRIAAMKAYNVVAEKHGLPKVQNLSKQREARLTARLRECGGIEGWKAAMDKLGASDFCTGRKTSWKASFDFILQESSFTKLMEGNYDNGKPPSNGNGPKNTSNSERNATGLLDWVDEDR